VTVVEKNVTPGGLMRGYRRGGFDCPVGVHYLGALAEGQPLRRLWNYLGVTSGIALEHMGVNGPIDRYIYDDAVFDLPEGLAAFSDNLHRAFPEERKLIDALMARLTEASRSLCRLDMISSPSELVLPLEKLSPMGDFLAAGRCSPRLTGVLGVAATLIGVPLKDCPLFYYDLILASYMLSAWRLRCGSSAMADTFAAQFQTMGGELRLGTAVAHILIASGRVTGVQLASGDVLAADTVIAAVHPQTVKAMLPPDSMRPGHSERIDGLRNTKGLVVVTATVDSNVHPALPYNLYRLYPEVDGALHRGLFFQIRDSGRPEKSLLTVMGTSDIVEWQTWSGTRSGNRGEEYMKTKAATAEKFLAEVEKLFGPMHDLDVLDVYTPLTIRDWVGSPEGSTYGIMRSSDQLMKSAFLNRPSPEGLYFAGQNSLAPGIVGTTIGSFQTVRRVVGRERFGREVLEAM
jgi:phytoene dehydrogenase-like protein